MTYGFIMIRHVNNMNHSEYWIKSYKSIRKFYPKVRIIIIDDDSNKDLINTTYEKSLYNTEVIYSEYHKRGEFLAYYYFLENNFFDIAVIIHDSVFINSRINLEFKNILTYKKLWDFKHNWNDKNNEVRLIEKLDNYKDILKLYYNKLKWKGCFGCMNIVNHNFLKFINSKYNLKILLNYIKSRENRMAFERIISCIFNLHDKNDISLYGDFLKYWGEDANKIDMDRLIYKKLPILKIWSGR